MSSHATIFIASLQVCDVFQKRKGKFMYKSYSVATQVSARINKRGGAHTHVIAHHPRVTHILVIPGQEQEFISTGTWLSLWSTQSIVFFCKLQMQLSGQEHCDGNWGDAPLIVIDMRIANFRKPIVSCSG